MSPQRSLGITLVEFYIQRCVALHQTHWSWYFEKLFFPCLGFSQKANTVGTPPNLWKFIYQSWGITEPWYFITLLLDSSLILIIYITKNTKFGSQNFGYQIWFCTRLQNRPYSYGACGMHYHILLQWSELDTVTGFIATGFFKIPWHFPDSIQCPWQNVTTKV